MTDVFYENNAKKDGGGDGVSEDLSRIESDSYECQKQSIRV